MASDPKHSTTQTGMSAVEQALFEGGDVAGAAAAGPSRPEVIAPDRGAVANDDRQEVGLLMQALRVKPSRRAYGVAFVASLLWLAGLAALVWWQGGGDPRPYLLGLTPCRRRRRRRRRSGRSCCSSSPPCWRCARWR